MHKWARPKRLTALFLTLVVVSTSYTKKIGELPADHIRRIRGVHGFCWGYEHGCRHKFHDPPECGEGGGDDIDPFSERPVAQVFYSQADFGYLRAIMDGNFPVCESEHKGSSLSCSEKLLFCRGKNLMLDLRGAYEADRSLKYQMDVLKPGEIGGLCDQKFDSNRLGLNLDHMSPLQSWAPEMRFFDGNVSTPEACDVIVDHRTLVVKLDATVNIYHHFCDFLNMYISLHLTRDADFFDPDKINILVWDNEQYRSSIARVFDAFTTNPILNLKSFGPNRVCFQGDVIFSVPPRTFFGLFYNTPLVDEPASTSVCRPKGSGLFKAFHEFLVARLLLPPRLPSSSVVAPLIRVTLISRRTRHRRVLNEESLVSALEATGRYQVTLAVFTHSSPDFDQQMATVHHTDVLVGVHGAGLTHMLFLPSWGVVFELYDCGDPGCYRDLARLRGVHYLSWTNESLVFPDKDDEKGGEKGANAKFRNYSLDPDEFVRKVDEAAELVLSHPDFVKLYAKEEL